MNWTNWLLVILVVFLISSPIYLPWILFRIGRLKRIFVAPRLPPVLWWKGIYGWPLSLVIISPPFFYLAGFRGEEILEATATLSSGAIIFALLLIIWTPNWAKPKWLRYLSKNYAHDEIARFVPVWRQMGNEWAELMDSEDGIDKAVRFAREKLNDPNSRTPSNYTST